MENPTDAIASALLEKFVIRSDVFAVQRAEGGYVKVEAPLTLEVVREHLEGRRTIGVYQLSVDNRVKWLCMDLDPEKLDDPAETAERILGVCMEKQLDKDGVKRPRVWEHSILLEASRYPDSSYHIWILFLVPVPARVARWLGFRLLELAGLSPKHVEVFPKQDAVSDILPYGNLVKLPLGLHQVEQKWSCFLHPETFEPLPGEILLEKVGLSFMEADIKRILDMKDKGVQARLEGAFSQPASPTGEPLSSNERRFYADFLCKLWVPGYNVKETARKWHELGVPVIPVHLTLDDGGRSGKRPLVQWGVWQYRSQTPEEFESLPWTKCNREFELREVDYDLLPKMR